jgi:energy-converting hydrogenase Eha subunit C
MVLAGVVIARMPETSTLRAGARASLRPRVGIPAHLRADVFGLVPILVASWALGGLYLSLGPSVAASVFGLHSHLIGGLVVTLLCGTGAATALVMRSRPVDRVLRIAAGLLAAGMLVTLAGVEAEAAGVAAAGTVVAGIGFGAAALGGFGTLARIAAPEERGELFAVVYIISYLAFSLPAVVAGFASTSVGLRPTALVYGLGVVGLGLAALGAQRALATRRRRECLVGS